MAIQRRSRLQRIQDVIVARKLIIATTAFNVLIGIMLFVFSEIIIVDSLDNYFSSLFTNGILSGEDIIFITMTIYFGMLYGVLCGIAVIPFHDRRAVLTSLGALGTSYFSTMLLGMGAMYFFPGYVLNDVTAFTAYIDWGTMSLHNTAIPLVIAALVYLCTDTPLKLVLNING